MDQLPRVMLASLAYRDDVNKLLGQDFQDLLCEPFDTLHSLATDEVAEFLEGASKSNLTSIYNLGPEAHTFAEKLINQIDYVQHIMDEKLANAKSSGQVVSTTTSEWIQCLDSDLIRLRNSAEELNGWALKTHLQKPKDTKPLDLRAVDFFPDPAQPRSNIGNKARNKSSKKASKMNAASNNRRRSEVFIRRTPVSLQSISGSTPGAGTSAVSPSTERERDRYLRNGRQLLEGFQTDFENACKRCQTNHKLCPPTLTEYYVHDLETTWSARAEYMENMAKNLETKASEEGTGKDSTDARELAQQLKEAAKSISEGIKKQVENNHPSILTKRYQYPDASAWEKLLADGQIHQVSPPTALKSNTELPNTLFECRITPRAIALQIPCINF